MLIAAVLLYFLFPHASNNHRPKLLNPLIIGVSVFMFLVTQVVVSSLPKFTPVVLGYASNISPNEIVDLTNQERLRGGVQGLQLDPVLSEAARNKAADMFAKDYWAHTAPDGTEPWQFFVNSGYRYRFAGENLARDFGNSKSVVKAWMESASHKENLVSPRYYDIGVAVVDGELNGVETTLVVQFFGTQMSQAGVVEETTVEQPTIPVSLPEGPMIAGTARDAGSILLSPFSTTRNLAIFLVSLFFLVVTLDMVIIKRKNITRISSKSFAHALFFGLILIVLYAAQSGLIL